MNRTPVLFVLLGAMLVATWAATPAVPATGGRSVPSGHMLPILHRSAMNAVFAGRPETPGPAHIDWAGDVLIDTGYVYDFAVDWNTTDGTMWLAEAPMLESIVNIYHSTDHGLTWDRVFYFHSVPLSTVKRLGLVLGEGESSYVNIFFWHPAENGNIAVVRLKPDLSDWDSYWVSTGPDSITDFAVCRDYRYSYSLYCWAVIGNRGQNAPFLWSRDYGKTWTGTGWFNVIEPCLAPSAGPRINLACVNAGREFVTAGFNYNYGDSSSWSYGIVNGDTYRCYRPKIAAANTEPDSIATRWVMYTKDYYNTGDLDAMYAVRSHAWGDTWQKENVLRNYGSYLEGIGDIQHFKAIGNPYVNATYSELLRSTGDTSDNYWTWAHADNPYSWATRTRVNDSATLVSYPTSVCASRVVYSPGAPATGGGVVYTRAGLFYIPHGLYFDAPWIVAGVAEQRGRSALRLAIAPSVARGPVVLTLPEGTRRVAVFDAAGREVRVLVAPAGVLRWDLRDKAGARLGPGVYVLRAETEQGAASGKVVVR
jgi:hypothetical protein